MLKTGPSTSDKGCTHASVSATIIEDEPISIMCTDTTIIFNSKIIDLMILNHIDQMA